MRFRFIPLIAIVLCCASCANKDYDISEGFNKEITLFENGISVPIGSVGPFTVNSILGKVSEMEGIGSMVGEYIHVDDDGFLYFEENHDIFRMNVYEIEKDLGDVSTAQTWDAGYQSGYIEGIVGLMPYIWLKPVNQKLVITATNPLRGDIHASCSASVWAYTEDDMINIPIPGLDDCVMPGRATEEILAMDLDESLSIPFSMIAFSDLTLDLPAKPVSKADKTDNLFFAFSFNYRCGIAITEEFNINAGEISTGRIDLEIGKYLLKKCQVTVEIENTLPLSATVSGFKVLKPRAGKEEEAVVDDNIVIDADITVPGGSPENPATTTAVISIEAKEGTIPDIPEVLLSLVLNGQAGLGDVALNTSQGLTVKSSSAKLTGGITIPIK